MTRVARLPRAARWLLRFTPVPAGTRADVEEDLHELFLERREERGRLHAHARLYRDIVSLWPSRPVVVTARRRFPFGLLRDAATDVRYAARLFARQRVIMVMAILGLSFGLGIATSAFSIMNVAVLRGDGLVDAARMPGVLKTTARSMSTSWTYDEFLHLREGATRMQLDATIAGTAAVRATASDSDAPSASVAFVSGSFFGTTGAGLATGRLLVASDEQHADAAPVVVSFDFWASRLNQDPLVLGRTLRVGHADATIVGVAARAFTAPNNRALWLPMTAYGAVYGAKAGRRTPETGVEVFGRLLPDASVQDAEDQLSGVAAALPRTATDPESPLQVRLDTGVGLGRASSADTLAVAVPVFAVIGLVLLLACANVATVLIASAITREREMAMRAALGAGRARMLRQLVTESLAIGVVAAGVGLLLATWTLPVIGRLIEVPAGNDLAPDANVFVFLGIVTLVTGVAAGLAPARHGRGVDLVAALTGEARQSRPAPTRLRSALVMTQAAVSVLLIVMATLFVRATARAATIDVGFDGTGLYSVSAGLGDPYAVDGAATREFLARAITELQAVPGVASTTLAELTPFGGLVRTSSPGDLPDRVIWFNRTRAEYFDTMGLRTLAGRTFAPDEIATGAPVALVSQSLARAYWPGASPLGQLLPPAIPIPQDPPTTVRPVVIGVVADAITERLDERNALTVYQPLDPSRERFAQLLFRVTPGGVGVIDQVSERLRAIDSQADVRVTSIAALLRQQAGRPRMLARLSAIVGVVAVVLCVIGLYGLTASVVGQRSREMAVRAALGADARGLLRLLMWDSLRPVVVGLVLGAGAAMLASRVVLSAMLFGVSPQDPIAFAGAAAILLVAAAAAVWVPTRTAASTDAAVVLKGS